MHRTLSIFRIIAATVVASYSISGILHAAETNVFTWTGRPELSADQQKMLQLQKSAETGREDSPLRAERKAELAALQKKLGPLAVRYAKADELIMSRMSTNVCSIFNPTAERLVLTVSVVGDVERLGTAMASRGRQAYFPPGSTIIVTNLYWTTPSTAKTPTK